MTFAHRGAGLGYSGGLPAPAGPMVARRTCNDPSSRFTPVIVTAAPTLMSVIRAARAIQIAVSGPMVIFRSPSLSGTVRTVPSGEAFVFLLEPATHDRPQGSPTACAASAKTWA